MPRQDSQIRGTALRIAQARHEERSRFARFLHDEIGQFLSGVGLQLDILRMDLEERLPEIGPRTQDIQRMLEHLVERARSFSYELNPEIAGAPNSIPLAGKARPRGRRSGGPRLTSGGNDVAERDPG